MRMTAPQIDRALLALVCALALGCGARSGLYVDEHESDLTDAGVDVVEVDSGIDAPFDAPPDVPPDVQPDVPIDAWIPMCPDSRTVAAREASVPVDIIWALDSSGSMLDDAMRMRENVNIFWDSITSADVDARVIFVAEAGYAPGAPVEFARRYVEVDEEVDSWNPLSVLANNFRDYERFLRADATTHFVVVTDDDSRVMEWETFNEIMLEQLGHEYFFHAVASERVTPSPANPLGVCSTPTSAAFRPGWEYMGLTEATGGLFLSICNEDWSELFTLLSERIAIRIPLPCGYSLPIPPPPGIEYYPERFTLLWQLPGEAGPRVLPRAGDTEDACGEGWWYFEGSDRINLCPSTCEEVEALGGSVTVDMGCDPLDP